MCIYCKFISFIKDEIIYTIYIIFFLTISSLKALENKIILKVDNEIITTLDIFEEIKNLKFFNKNLNQINDNEIYQIALQSVINYKIKENQILKVFNKIDLTDNEYLNYVIEDTYKKLGFSNIIEFKNKLNDNNIKFNSYEKKLKINILWNQIIYSKFNDKLVVDLNELKKQIRNQKKNNKIFNLSEIVFQIDNINELNDKYLAIKKDIKELGFENAALKHSISNTSGNGGELGWIDEKLLNKEILNILDALEFNNITKPIRVTGGFIILKKNDFKQVAKELDFDKELDRLVNYQKEKQLSSYSNLYFNKIKKDLKINAP